MNKSTILRSLVILLCVSSIASHRASLELALEKTVFLVGETITATVTIE